VGFVALEDIRRQREDWQRAASVDFGRHRTDQGLAAYAERGAVRLQESVEQARAEIVCDVVADMAARPDGSRLVLAHRNADVQALNEAIRAVRKERGELEGERVYRTAEGERAFAPGDRVLFRENNRELGVKNGMLATVERAEDGRRGVRLDSAQGPGQGRVVIVSMEDYSAIDHGYATTIHKAQGATVNRAYVLASGTMDRHLTYVAMTRHREAVQLYAGREEFSDVNALSARLSRSHAKETTLDYDRSAYAERRGIALKREMEVPAAGRERVVEPGIERGAAPPERKRSLFEGLKLSTGRMVQREGQRDALANVRVPVQTRAAQRGQREEAPSLSRAVERYARAWTDAARMQTQALPVLEYQKVALREAGEALEAARPGATQDLLNALKYEPAAYEAMTQRQGRERAGQRESGGSHAVYGWRAQKRSAA
jgi:hypothetical protein